VRKKKGDFRRIMRGYDPALVDDFLDLVADRMEQLVREHMTLTERVTRQDQQVSEYRDRERALTDALVTAQEMREEIRKQTAREAEQSKQSAEQEVSRMRASVHQELTAAQQEVSTLRSTAHREAQEIQSAARREAQELKAAAQREAAQLRSQLLQEQEREEEALRRVRDRHEQFVARYRGFLERELHEIAALGSSFGSAAEAEDARGPAAGSASPLAASAPVLSAGAAELSMTDDFAAPGDDPEAVDLAYAEPASGLDDVGVTDDLEMEPFEPEPLEPEDTPNEVEAEQSAEPESEPEPMGLGSGGWATPQWAGPKLDLAEPPSRTIDFGADIEAPADGEDELEDMSQLLRNAEAAGYRIDNLEGEEELLLEEELPEKKDDDDGWLDSLIEDEK
jgi:DivIVA domain-containing protein